MMTRHIRFVALFSETLDSLKDSNHSCAKIFPRFYVEHQSGVQIVHGTLDEKMMTVRWFQTEVDIDSTR